CPGIAEFPTHKNRAAKRNHAGPRQAPVRRRHTPGDPGSEAPIIEILHEVVPSWHAASTVAMYPERLCSPSNKVKAPQRGGNHRSWMRPINSRPEHDESTGIAESIVQTRGKRKPSRRTQRSLIHFSTHSDASLDSF